MTVQTVKTLSELVNTPVEKLLTQMKEAGLSQSSESQEVSDAEKQVLLKHLQRAHGGDGSDDKSSQRITLQRKKTSTLKGGDNKTVNVEVRKKRTYVKRNEAEDDTAKQQEQLAQSQAEEQAKLVAEEKARLAVEESARQVAERKMLNVLILAHRKVKILT